MLDDLISAVASRYGFRESDYRVIWDGQEFSGNRDPHQLVIAIKDGRTITATRQRSNLCKRMGAHFVILRTLSKSCNAASLRTRERVRGMSIVGMT